MFLAKYVSLDLYDKDLEKRFIIKHEKFKFDKNAGYTLIGMPEKPGGTLSDNWYFFIHDDIFERIQ